MGLQSANLGILGGVGLLQVGGVGLQSSNLGILAGGGLLHVTGFLNIFGCCLQGLLGRGGLLQVTGFLNIFCCCLQATLGPGGFGLQSSNLGILLGGGFVFLGGGEGLVFGSTSVSESLFLGGNKLGGGVLNNLSCINHWLFFVSCKTNIRTRKLIYYFSQGSSSHSWHGLG